MKNDNKKKHDFDLVDEAGKESFPASDPPVWTTGYKKKEVKKEKSLNKKGNLK